MEQKIINKYSALNDAVLERTYLSQLVPFSIYTNNKYIFSTKSDGLIVSSPTGSTAYNLASGGPILHSQVSAFIITSVCSHSLTNRPVVFPDTKNLKIQIESQTKPAHLIVDGQIKEKITHKHSVHISKARVSHWTLKRGVSLSLCTFTKKTSLWTKKLV